MMMALYVLVAISGLLEAAMGISMAIAGRGHFLLAAVPNAVWDALPGSRFIVLFAALACLAAAALHAYLLRGLMDDRAEAHTLVQAYGVFALLGGIILEVFGVTLEAFRIGGGILLFLIGMEMVYARVSRSKLTATEKYEGLEAEDVAVMPLALPMISGPGAITTTIVLVNESGGNLLEIALVIVFIGFAIGMTYIMMRNSDLIVSRVGERGSRAVNRLMGILLIAIAVQFVINGLMAAFPALGG